MNNDKAVNDLIKATHDLTITLERVINILDTMCTTIINLNDRVTRLENQINDISTLRRR